MRMPDPRTPTQRDGHRGLAYELWLPPNDPPPWPGVVIIHGAGSSKERHADFARLASDLGWAAIGYDQRGHGASEGEFSPGCILDAGAMVRLLSHVDGVDTGRVCLRGSSLGGFVAIHTAATNPAVAGVIAICPASEELLLRGLRAGRFDMRVDASALEPWLEEHDLRDAVELLDEKPLILLHASGDDRIPSAFSEELHERAMGPRRIIVVPGGHHGSVQHDAELQGVALGWLARQLRREPGTAEARGR